MKTKLLLFASLVVSTAGTFLDERTEILAHDHGSPTHPIYYVYQNTFLMQQGPWRGYYAFTWARTCAEPRAACSIISSSKSRG